MNKVTSRDGITIAFDQLGDGSPVVLVCGGSTDRMANAQAGVMRAIDGGASFPWIRKTAQAIADVIPDAQHRTLEGQTHNVASEAIAPVLEEFFARGNKRRGSVSGEDR